MSAMVDWQLRHFEQDEIIVSADDANLILRYFFGEEVPPAGQLTNEDVGFAQALFLEAIDKSYAMGYVHIIFDCFYMKVAGSFDDVKDLAKDFTKKAGKRWFDHATGKDLGKPEIYNNVFAQMKASFRETWKMRMQGASLTY